MGLITNIWHTFHELCIWLQHKYINSNTTMWKCVYRHSKSTELHLLSMRFSHIIDLSMDLSIWADVRFNCLLYTELVGIFLFSISILLALCHIKSIVGHVLANIWCLCGVSFYSVRQWVNPGAFLSHSDEEKGVGDRLCSVYVCQINCRRRQEVGYTSVRNVWWTLHNVWLTNTHTNTRRYGLM